MKGLDLSKFKKISEGEDKTTLQHPDGHEINIAHSALTKKMREELKKLPGIKPVMMARGGESQIQPVTDQEPGDQIVADEAPVEESAPAEESQPAPITSLDDRAQYIAQNYPAPESQGIAALPEQPQNNVTQAAPMPTSQPAPAQAASMQPVAAAMPAPRPTFEQIKQNDAQQYIQQAQMYGDDISKGFIKPKTYQQLFDNKDTLGKIGTIFGMMLSGAGSAMAGQQNAFMEIMKQQIDQDLDSQKANVGASQTFYKLNLDKQITDASVMKTKADELMVQAQITKVPEEKSRLIAEAQGIYAQAEKTRQSAKLDAQVNAHNQAMASAYHQLSLSPMANTPEGQQMLAVLYTQMQASIVNASDAAAGMKSLATIAGGMAQNEQPGATTPAVDYNRVTMLKNGKVISEGDVAQINKEAGDIEDANAQEAIYKRSFKDFNTIAAGKATPGDRNAAIKTLSTIMPPEQAEALFPQIGDKEETRKHKYQNALSYFAQKRAATPTLKRFGLIKQPTRGANRVEATPAKYTEGQTGKSKKTGKKMIFRNGNWEPL